jgi:RNA polymerase sigma factor (sigma-70 family)
MDSPTWDALAERRRLVALCARLTGAPQAAEDLAHEVLCRALAGAHLADPGRRRAWLDGIARHVCVDWMRARRRERSAAPTPGEPQDPLDLDLELDRRELVALLDRALGLLPDDTRSALIDHYVRDLPQVEIALRRGWSPGAVAMRLQRGRRALRDLLMHEFRAEAADLGLVAPGAGPAWRPTRLWCRTCASRRLRARFHPAWGIHLECPDCTRGDAVPLHLEGPTPFGQTAAQLFAGIHGVRRAADRVAAAFHGLLQGGLPGLRVPCRFCGRPARLAVGGPCGDVEMLCPAGCGWHPGLIGIAGVAECRPEMVRFGHAHQRVRAVAPRFPEVAGTRAVVLGWESLASGDRIEFVYALAPMVCLGVYGNVPGAGMADAPGGMQQA